MGVFEVRMLCDLVSASSCLEARGLGGFSEPLVALCTKVPNQACKQNRLILLGLALSGQNRASRDSATRCKDGAGGCQEGARKVQRRVEGTRKWREGAKTVQGCNEGVSRVHGGWMVQG